MPGQRDRISIDPNIGLVQKRVGLGDTRATRRDVAQALLPGAESVRRSTGRSACATNCALQV